MRWTGEGLNMRVDSLGKDDTLSTVPGERAIIFIASAVLHTTAFTGKVGIRISF